MGCQMVITASTGTNATGLATASSGALATWIYFLTPHDVGDPDIWWHLRNAAIQLHSRTWLHCDLYSSTATGAPWLNHEWLAELPFYLGWHLAGATGLYLVTLLIIEAIFLGLFWLCYRQARSFPVATVATIFASVLATVSFGPRTLLLGWLCLVVELIMLECFASREWLALLLPALFAVWINLHGSWLIGLVLFVIFIISGSCRCNLRCIASSPWTAAQRNKLWAGCLLSVPTLFINPYGWRLVLYPFDMAFRQPLNIASVEEWQPPTLQSGRGLVLLLLLAALFLGQLVWRRRWILCELAFAAIGVYAACRHARFLFLAGILLAPVLGRQLAPLFGPAQTARRRTWLNAAWLAAILLLIVAGTIKGRRPRSADQEKFPLAAPSYLLTFHPQGRVFNEYLWGGYLIYYAPHIPVFIDSRMDIYERSGVLRDYLDIVHLRNSLGLLDRYQVDYVLFEKDTPLVYLLEQTHAWKTDYADNLVILLERRNLRDHLVNPLSGRLDPYSTETTPMGSATK
jgi:hypothetical protein